MRLGRLDDSMSGFLQRPGRAIVVSISIPLFVSIGLGEQRRQTLLVGLGVSFEDLLWIYGTYWEKSNR